MNDLTRRRFLKQGSIGLALAGALAVIPGVANFRKLPAGDSGLSPSSAEPLVAHVRDLASGEVALLVGIDRIVVRDHDLATRLFAAARQAR